MSYENKANHIQAKDGTYSFRVNKCSIKKVAGDIIR